MSQAADDARTSRLREVVDAAQRVAGALAARHRGEHDDAARLLGGFEDDRQLAGGALLLAELSLGLAARGSGDAVDDVVRDLCLQMESSLDAR